MIVDPENGSIDVVVAPKITPIPDNQEWEILQSSYDGYFHVCHYSSRLFLTCQNVGNMTVSEQGNLEIFLSGHKNCKNLPRLVWQYLIVYEKTGGEFPYMSMSEILNILLKSI